MPRTRSQPPPLAPPAEAERPFFDKLHDVEPGLVRLCVHALTAAVDIVSVERTCKRFATLVKACDAHWQAKARFRFGACVGPTLTPASATPGRDAWQHGCTQRSRLLALSDPLLQLQPALDIDEDTNDGFDGELVQACNEDFVVAASDGDSQIVVVRRIFGSDLVRTLPAWKPGWGDSQIRYVDCIAVFGPRDRALVALTTNTGSFVHLQRIDGTAGDEEYPIPGKPTCLLGSHDMLVAGSKASRRAHLVWNGPQAGPGNYVGLAQWEHATEAMPSWQTPRSRVEAMCWAPPFGAHAYAYSTRNREICISKPGALDKVIVQSTFDCCSLPSPDEIETDGYYSSLVVTESRIIATPVNTRYVVVFSLSGQVLRFLSEPGNHLDHARRYDPDRTNFMFSMYMAALGDVLITSSVREGVICVWNVRSGELYHRQTDYYEEDLYINGLHLVHGGARIFASFFCGSQCVWSV